MFCVGWFVASFCGAVLAADIAAAVSLTNRDARDHKVTIVEGDKQQEHTLKPSAMLDGLCAKGCIIRLNDSENDEYELDGTEVVSIEDGYLYYDGPDAPGEPEAGDAGKPQGPKQ